MKAPPRVKEILRAYWSATPVKPLYYTTSICITLDISLQCHFILGDLCFWHHDTNHLSQTPMQTKHIWDCHKQRQAPVISSFMFFQWLHRHELLRWAVTKEFDFVSWRNCVRPQIRSTPCEREILPGIRACFSEHCKGIFYRQGSSWSWRWGEVTCTASRGIILFLGYFYTAHNFGKHCPRNMICDSVWRALQPSEFFFATCNNASAI